MQRTNGLNTLNGLGEPIKVTTTGASDRARLGKLRDYLRGLHSLDFTEKGHLNICRRFYVSDEELTDAVAALQSPRPNAPTPELLRAIGAAVGHHHATEGGTAW